MGKEQNFRLKTLIIHKWKTIGGLVRVPRPYLMVWEEERNPEKSLDKVLSYWLDNASSRYPATWEGLRQLLNDSELSEVANELMKALDNGRRYKTFV